MWEEDSTGEGEERNGTSPTKPPGCQVNWKPGGKEGADRGEQCKAA